MNVSQIFNLVFSPLGAAVFGAALWVGFAALSMLARIFRR